jgi:hypothetical protein
MKAPRNKFKPVIVALAYLASVSAAHAEPESYSAVDSSQGPPEAGTLVASLSDTMGDESLLIGDTDFHYQSSAQAVLAGSSSYGAQLGASLQATPLQGHGLTAGPRLGVLAAGNSDGFRLDFSAGGEATLWFVNAIGPGFAFDVVAPSVTSSTQIDSHFHYRAESLLNVRVRHFRQTGALALRGSLFYDTQFKLGAGVGITLQFSGVPAAGNPDIL